MHVRVRFFGKPDCVVVVESKLTKIRKFRSIIQDKFGVKPKFQRLLYGGKLLEDDYTFHDYNIRLNDVIQLMVIAQPDISSTKDITIEERNNSNVISKNEKNEKFYSDAESALYVVGDLVDVRDKERGSWVEGKIIKICQDLETNGLIMGNSSRLGYDVDNDKRIQRLQTLDENNESTVSATYNITTRKRKKNITNYFTRLSNDSRRTKKQKISNEKQKIPEECLLFKVQLDTHDEDLILYCKLEEIRPRARSIIPINCLEVGQTVMVNHDPEDPLEKGHWYDFKVSEIKKFRTNYELVGTIYIGPDIVPQNDTKIRVHDSIFAIEEVVPLNERTKEYKKKMTVVPVKRSKPISCMTCRDNEEATCKDCGCFICLGKQYPDKIILCDECNFGYHMTCLAPPLTDLPDDDWYCPSCKRDPNCIIAPGAAKQTKKASTSKNGRDWGRGMACAGKTKTSTMPANHFGPIPGIEVGMCWRFRIQLSESGVHRPPVSGIHGRDAEGAYSIVLSGGYEDDIDNGYEFTYTGSGGRDLSGNKRTAEQSYDQSLTRENRALARNCAVNEISEKGADAGDKWREGKPVRVARSYKMLKHFPKYAPNEGIRYDGIYKVVKYYQESGLSGYRVWKYLLRRDDPSPAPWENKGTMSYSIIYPDGYLEAEAEKIKLKEISLKNTKGTNKKRVLQESNHKTESGNDASPPVKKKKLSYKIESQLKETKTSPKTKDIKKDKSILNQKKSKGTVPVLSVEETEAIKDDTLNSKIWTECISISQSGGKMEFVDYVTQMFVCIICQDVAVNPVTTPCLHNFCMTCIKQAFMVTDSNTCPYCRQDLSIYEPKYNEQLKKALRTILPGYDTGKK